MKTRSVKKEKETNKGKHRENEWVKEQKNDAAFQVSEEL